MPGPRARRLIAFKVTVFALVAPGLAAFPGTAVMARVGIVPPFLPGAVFGVLQVALGIRCKADVIGLALTLRNVG